MNLGEWEKPIPPNWAGVHRDGFAVPCTPVIFGIKLSVKFSVNSVPFSLYYNVITMSEGFV